MSEKIWSDDAWEDYLYWQTQDKKTIKRINQFIKDIERNGCMEGIGKPEPLTGDLQGEYSRRINDKDRPPGRDILFSIRIYRIIMGFL